MLVNTPDAERFMQLAQTEAGCRAFLGDATEFDSSIGPDIANSNISLRTAAAKVFGLSDDPTRTVVQRHDAARQIAEQTIAQLSKAKTAIMARAQSLKATGLGQADMLFAPDPSRSGIEGETRAWIKETMKKPTGIAKVRALADEDRQFASVLHHSPSYLIGIESTLHLTMRFEVLKKHYPETYVKVENAFRLEQLPPRYDKAIHGVRTSFYNLTVASQASRRVVV